MWLECSLCSKNCFFSLLPAISFEFPITRTPDDSNHFRFPLMVRVIGSRLYFSFWAWPWSLEIQLQEGSRTCDKVRNRVGIIAKKTEETQSPYFLVSARRYIHIPTYSTTTLFLEKSTEIPQPSPAKKKRTSPYRVKLDVTEHLNAIVLRYSYVLWPRHVTFFFYLSLSWWTLNIDFNYCQLLKDFYDLRHCCKEGDVTV